MADPRREQDDEPLTQLDVDIDKRQLDSSVEREATTSPGGLGPDTAARPDDEPQTMEPPRVLGVPRLRAHTMLGVAPPSSGATSPPTTQPQLSSGIPKIVFDGDDERDITETKPADIPRIVVDGDDEQTTMVGKLLAEARSEVAKKLKEPAEPDLYADETATTVGDAEKIIAAANFASVPKVSLPEGEDLDETTASGSVRDASMEDVTSKRDAIDVETALARAADLRAEAEKKKKQAKKRTMHGLGDGPLRLPARPTRPEEEEIPTFENKLPETGERPASTRSSGRLAAAPAFPDAVDPADGEMETLSASVPHPAPMRSIGTEPETMPVQVPSTPRERQATAPADPSALLGAPAFDQTLAIPPNASPYTQPMPHAPTVRMDDGGGMDPALKQTMNSPMHQHGGPGGGQYPMTPSGGVPAYHSAPMPAHGQQYSMQPHSGPAAFARTAVATGSGPAVAPPPKKKKGGGAIVFMLLLLVGLGGIGYWQRATLKALWDQSRQPAPPSTETTPSATAPVTASTAPAPPTVPPPVTTDTAPHASSSAAPHGSAPHGSASASASASSSAPAKPPTKKPPPWRPPPKPKPAGASPKPKPVDDNRGF